MSEVIFDYDEGRATDRAAIYRRVSRREYYEGEYQIVPTGNANVRIEKGLDATASIIRLTSSSPLKFKRNWDHIRRDHLDLTVFWFVLKGSIAFSYPGGTRLVESGHCAISRSQRPFRMDCLVDTESRHEVLHVIAPLHMVADHIPVDLKPGASLPSASGDCRLALDIFELLYVQGSAISTPAADGLVSEAIRTIGSLITPDHRTRPHSAIELRFDAICGFVARNLANPKLSVDMVAAALGISPSYVFHVMKARGTSFHTMVWDGRIERARQLLLSGQMAGHPIKQIAHMAGFGNAAHFSRMFRQHMDCTPGEFRRAALVRFDT